MEIKNQNEISYVGISLTAFSKLFLGLFQTSRFSCAERIKNNR
jgi:hypothetical protein